MSKNSQMSMMGSSATTLPFLSSALWVLCDPEDIRFRLLREAGERKGIIVEALDYRALLLRGEDALSGVPVGALLRIESPGRDLPLRDLFIKAGGGKSEVPAHAVPSEAWFLGFSGLLGRLQRWCQKRGIRLLSEPTDITRAFDKLTAAGALEAAGVPRPKWLGQVLGFEQLLALMQQHTRRVFVKSRYGSAGAGIVALQESRGRFRAYTTVSLERGASTQSGPLLNTRKILQLNGYREIRSLINGLSREGAIAEQWVPKASCDGRSSDVRMVVLNQTVTHTVVRASQSPITNLHLGGLRFEKDRLRSLLSDAHWQSLQYSARKAARAFPGLFNPGVDLAVSSNLRRHVVLEVNAFGDLLKGVTGDRGSTYDHELELLVSAEEHHACA